MIYHLNQILLIDVIIKPYKNFSSYIAKENILLLIFGTRGNNQKKKKQNNLTDHGGRSKLHEMLPHQDIDILELDS